MIYIVGYFAAGVVLFLYDRSRPVYDQPEYATKSAGWIVLFIILWPLAVLARLSH